ncbi:hypothetical protein DSO57_1003342 [Entomophthora muscae]|uniref:Uncharacterized protein n=1 Tax=Entomophthora muscae TaxID=34485 RepID=A0ACC2U7P6_9FUNG|nr:hypothetical protein DSO57_1003342 [Entomophthora muscae]
MASITGDNSLDPNWPMLYLRPEVIHYEGLYLVTISKLKDNESQFITDAGNVCCRAETGEKTPYIPTTQQGDTILHYHCTLGHVRGLKYIITAINYFTCWPVVWATTNHTATTTTCFIGKEIVACFG